MSCIFSSIIVLRHMQYFLPVLLLHVLSISIFVAVLSILANMRFYNYGLKRFCISNSTK